jgi:hypothetical protein
MALQPRTFRVTRDDVWVIDKGDVTLPPGGVSIVVPKTVSVPCGNVISADSKGGSCTTWRDSQQRRAEALLALGLVVGIGSLIAFRPKSASQLASGSDP